MSGLVIVVGSINMDLSAEVEEFPSPGETVEGENLEQVPGGKGSNQAVAASRLGSDVKMVGKVGDDGFGRDLLEFLEDENLDTENITVSRGAHTGTALITVDRTGQNQITVVPGSNYELAPEDIEDVKMREQDVVLSQFEVPKATIETAFEKAKNKGATTILNPAPAGECSEGLLENTDHLIVNETELAALADTDAPQTKEEALKASEKLRKEGQKVITTLGSKGAVTVSDNSRKKFETHDIDRVDTTGAGDCFVGGYITALEEGKDLEEAVRFGISAAEVSIQRKGASTSLPERREVEKFRENYQ